MANYRDILSIINYKLIISLLLLYGSKKNYIFIRKY